MRASAGLFALALIFPDATARSRPGGVATLMAESSAVAAVEILSTDYTATAADGPMYANARVLRVVKGPLDSRATFRFAAVAWTGPNYRAGETRVVFLGKAPPVFSKAPWVSIEPGRVDLFVHADGLAGLTESALAGYLRAAEKATPPTLDCSLIERAALSIRLVNTTQHPLWIHPARVEAQIHAGNIQYALPVAWKVTRPDAWLAIDPGADLAGTSVAPIEQTRGARRIDIGIRNQSLLFPHPGWMGFRSAAIWLRPGQGLVPAHRSR
ncbi:MAG: hypothetical protein ACRD8O_07265 [Bryobacteraceae bacterium]